MTQTHTHTEHWVYYAVEIPEVDFPSPPVSFDWKQGAGGVKLASGRLLLKDGMEDGDGGSSVLLGLLMSPSPTSVRSAWVSSSTVRRLGRGMGDRWVPNAGWRGGGMRHLLVPEGPLALELREESRLSDRKLEVKAPLEETPFSLLCFRESGVEEARSEGAGGVSRRKSGSTRSSLFRRPRWSLARALWARLRSSKNSAETQNIFQSETLHTQEPD